ncbi:alkaline phosphatase D family protein [Planobispora rosea]|uniref:alkaline phosphatase D family protein n=1 Tax=Planobispora rosea TaxID=35762 RepID=UPI00159F1C71|nr:alkaline phosphatase D family protein [Planobispora rosea]
MDVVSVGTAASLTYDTTNSGYHGDRAIKVTTGASVVNCYAAWTNMYRPASGAAQIATVWMYFTANPTTVSVLLVANASVQRIVEMRVTGTGKIRVLNGAGTNVLETTTSIALNQWVRADLLFTPHASSGSVQVKLYNTPSSSTPTETTAVVSGQNLRQAQVEGVYCGITNGITNLTYWMQAVVTDGAAVPATGGWVMSRWLGAVTESSVGVAARVLGASSVRLKVSTSSNLLTSPTYSSAQSPDSDGTVRMSVTGLSADTVYYYGIEVDGVVDSEFNGSFRSAPTPGSQKSFVFCAASCAQNNSNVTTFDAIRGESPAFMIHLGDLHYRDISSNDQIAYHRAYDQVMSGPRYARMLGEVPTPYIWSDHDSTGPNGDGTAASVPAANAVYRSRVPAYAGMPSTTGTYFAFTWGRVRFVCTDGRSFASPIAQTDDSNKTKLGSTQLAWLLDELTDDTYPLIIWAHEDAVSNGPTFAGDDTWSAYSTERATIFAAIAAAGTNVAYICGDLHSLSADDGTNVPAAGANSGVPVHVAAAMDNTSYSGNGTYTAGTYPLTDGVAVNQYGRFVITDSGTEIELLFQGKDSGGTVRITQTSSWILATPVTGTLAGTAPAATGAMAGEIAVRGALAGQAPAAAGSASGVVTVSGSLAGTTPAAAGTFAGDARVTGQLAGTAPTAAGDFQGGALVAGQLAGQALAATAEMVGAVTITGSLAGAAPSVTAGFAGVVAGASGVLSGIAPAVVGAFMGVSHAVAAPPARLSSGSAAAVDLSGSSEQLAVLTGGTA